MLKLIKKLLSVPDCVAREHYRFIQMSNYIYLVSFFVHLILVPVFYLLGARVMMTFNLFISLPIFIFAIYINHRVRCYFNLAFSLAIGEFILHQTFAINYFGWQSGFQYYLFLVSAVVFFNSYWKSWFKVVVFSCIIAIFISLFFISESITPAFDLEELTYPIMIVNASISFIVYAVIISYYIRTAWTAEKNLDKAVEDISKQKQILSEQNNDIMSSIEYAKIIQDAILPGRNQINTIFSDIFIFYKPKDIVSGDFYWINYTGQYRYLIVADCTGHGVPGAFMSMISNTLFNNIIIEKGIVEPAEILSHLHQGIRSSLRQDSERSNTDDGLDVALLRIDTTEKKAVFAGAKRPLYFVYDGDVEKIKGDLYSIGGKQRRGFPEFTNHEIDYKDNTLFCLFSDGFTDQGGDESNKYGIKRFKPLMSKLYYLSCEEAEKALAEELKNFQGSQPQRDDITVVGIHL